MIDDPVAYLANVVAVAYGDGKLSPNELGVLELVRQELGFKKSDYNAAMRVVEAGKHRISPIGSFADQVRNLEHILRVAYADGEMDASEVRLISGFSKATGITPEQFQRLCREVLATPKSETVVCPSCARKNAPDAHFCAQCGADLTAGVRELPAEYEIPSSGIAIEFAESTAAAFPVALEIAKSASTYQTCQKAKRTWHLAVYPAGDFAAAVPLAGSLSPMRNRSVYIDGERQQWDEVFGFAWCAGHREAAYRPATYCFGADDGRLNPWGCIQARMEWSEWADWFRYGRWVAGRTGSKEVKWLFDKERIRHELAANLHGCRFCPHLRADLVEAVLQELPDEVMPSSDPDWGFHQNYEETPGAIKVVEKQGTGVFEYANEYWSDGPRPNGLRALSAIMRRAFQSLGLSWGEVRELLP